MRQPSLLPGLTIQIPEMPGSRMITVTRKLWILDDYLIKFIFGRINFHFYRERCNIDKSRHKSNFSLTIESCSKRTNFSTEYFPRDVYKFSQFRIYSVWKGIHSLKAFYVLWVSSAIRSCSKNKTKFCHEPHFDTNI